jgi:4-amino-4-deoxy-L-arabinose transferase-like glycosyltransferase
MSRREVLAFGAMLLGGAVVRMAWIAYAARPPVGLIDPLFYSGLAGDLARGDGYTYLGLAPSAYYPPGYPMALAAVIWTFDRLGLAYDLPTLVGGVNLVLGLACVVLVFDIGRRLFDRRAAWVAAALVCFWPNLVFHSAVALSETLCNTLLLAAVVVVLRWDKWPALVGAGALLGAATLVRPVVLPVVGALFVVWTVTSHWQRALRSTAVVTAVAIAMVVPWTIRNTATFHQPVLISTNFGDNLCIGHNPDATGEFDTPAWCFAGYEGPQNEIRRNSDLARKGLGWAVHHPVSEVALVFKRAWFTVHHDHDGLLAAESYGADRFLPNPLRHGLGLVADLWFVVTLAAAAVGYRRLRPSEDPRRWLLVAAPAALALSPLVFFGDARFKVPMVPFLALAAGAAFATRTSSPRGTPPPH